MAEMIMKCSEGNGIPQNLKNFGPFYILAGNYQK